MVRCGPSDTPYERMYVYNSNNFATPAALAEVCAVLSAISVYLLCPAPNRQGIKRCFCLTSVCLSVAYIWPKSRTEV